MPKNLLGSALVVAVMLAASSAPVPSLAETKIGVASAVRNDVTGIQAGSSRGLSTGSSVFEQEIVRTGAESVAQLLFLDQTSFSIGPSSEVTLDRFVYDPSRGTGDVLLSATKGAFRFVSGSQNPLHYKISTPTATIGVRGTIIDCAVGSLTCIVQEGRAVISVGGVDYALKAGEALTIGDNGKVIGPYQHDGVFDAIKFATPWPLFGGALPTEQWRVEAPDNATTRIEDILGVPRETCESYFCGQCY